MIYFLRSISSAKNSWRKALCVLVTFSAMANAEPQKIQVPYLSSVANFSEGRAPVTARHRLGFINKQGTIAVPLKYDEVGDFKNGFASVRVGYYVGLVDKDGIEVVSPNRYLWISDVSNGFALVVEEGWRFKDAVRDVKVGVIDDTGRIVLAPDYYVVESTGINWFGHFVVSPLLPSKSSIRETLYRALGAGKPLALSDSNKRGLFENGLLFLAKRIAQTTSSSHPSLITDRLDWGAIDKTGKTALNFEYVNVVPRSLSTKGQVLAWIRGQNAYALIDVYDNAKPLTEGKYYEWNNKDSNDHDYRKLSDWSEGLLPVRGLEKAGYFSWETKHGYLDENGLEAIPLKYDEAKPFHEGLGVVVMYKNKGQTKSYGAIDRDNQLVVGLQPYSIDSPFKNGVALISEIIKANYSYTTRKGVGYLRRDSKVLAKPSKRIDPDWKILDVDMLPYCEQVERCGYIDKSGAPVIPFKYKTVDQWVVNSLALATPINFPTQVLINRQHQVLAHGAFERLNNGYLIRKYTPDDSNTPQCTLLDPHGAEVPGAVNRPCLSKAYRFEDGLAGRTEKGRTIFINSEGEVVLTSELLMP